MASGESKGKPDLMEWVRWGGFVVGMVGGLLGGGVATYNSVAVPSPAEKIQSVRADVDALQGAVNSLTATMTAHVTSDAERAAIVRDHERRLQQIEAAQGVIEDRLDRMTVNQLLICRAVDAPCDR